MSKLVENGSGGWAPMGGARRWRRWTLGMAAVMLAGVGAACTAPMRGPEAPLDTQGTAAMVGRQTPPQTQGAAPEAAAGAVAPAAEVAADDPSPYPTAGAPVEDALPTQGELDRLLKLLQPWLPAEQVALPAGTPPGLAEPAAGWLPRYRIVAYYGNPLSAGMGVLGWYPPEETMARLASQAQAYAQADPSHPVLPAVDLVADVAQGSPGADGAYRLRMPYSMMEDELALARRHKGILILEVQVGRSTVPDELPYFLPFLSQPDVMLALDPEFDMPPGEVPGRWIGTTSSAEINWAVQYVSDLVQRLHLPPKIVIVHQFTDGMVPDWRGIRLAPGVQFILDTDGYGGQSVKHANYQKYIALQPVPPVRYGGIKLFYKYDSDLMTPAQVVALQPEPSLVIYQ